MVFSDVIFLHWFLPLFFAVYFLTPFRGRALVIALASYLFYGWWRPDFVLLMGLSTVVDFQCGRRIEAAQSAGHRGRGWLVASLVVNLGLLGWFKYADFGIASFNAITTRLGWEPIPAMSIVLPVGISFYTFQTMSYTIDVYRREAPPAARFVDFMAYVALFPQLVAGPIVRYGTIAKELVTRRHDLPSFAEGVLFFQTGLAKKLLIADRVAPIVDAAFLQSGLSVADAWIGILAYAVQIYFDFSGYSDMAIGLGRMIGFHFPINFDSPYRATSITDFWRRWHISLSSWLRDYLYLPLGGNRRGGLFTYRNLALT
ncbi:MAG: MBOAT family protein, partial [Planctomycetes bacterium]|nr:MBOAT family protein [Planctomycetota bacterium]